VGRAVGAFGLLIAAPAAAAAGAVFNPAAATAGLLIVGGVLLLLKPDVSAVLAVAALPFPVSIAPGLAVELSATDLLILLALVGWLLQEVLQPGRAARVRVLRSLRIPLAVYGAVMILGVVVHPSVPAVATALQRIALVIGGLLLGAGLVRMGRLRLSLELYLAAASVLAVGAMLDSGAGEILGGQKNPSGGFIAAALFIAILVKPSPRWILYAPVLTIGLLATQSRGALTAAFVAAGVSVVIVRFGDSLRLMITFVGVGILLLATYTFLPESAQVRLLRFTAGDDYAIRFREDFQADAWDQFVSAPWTGIGVGNYVGGPRLPGITDPHQVLIFQLAEGGVPLLLAFLLLAIGSAVVVLRQSRVSPLALAALCVQIATVVHALADVYWVRGTPTPAWMLIGASLAAVQLARRGDLLGREWARPRSTQPRHRRTRVEKAAAVGPGQVPAADTSVG